jgi:hypothetical protein
LFAFKCGSCGVETNGLDEQIKIVDDALVKGVEWRSPLGIEPSVWFDRAERGRPGEPPVCLGARA